MRCRESGVAPNRVSLKHYVFLAPSLSFLPPTWHSPDSRALSLCLSGQPSASDHLEPIRFLVPWVLPMNWIISYEFRVFSSWVCPYVYVCIWVFMCPVEQACVYVKAAGQFWMLFLKHHPPCFWHRVSCHISLVSWPPSPLDPPVSVSPGLWLQMHPAHLTLRIKPRPSCLPSKCFTDCSISLGTNSMPFLLEGSRGGTQGLSLAELKVKVREHWYHYLMSWLWVRKHRLVHFEEVASQAHFIYEPLDSAPGQPRKLHCEPEGLKIRVPGIPTTLHGTF